MVAIVMVYSYHGGAGDYMVAMLMVIVMAMVVVINVAVIIW